MRTWKVLIVGLILTLASCASINPIKDPEVKLVGIEPTKTQGFSQHFSLKLLVTNPNAFDLDIEGVNFNLDVADQKVMGGVSNAVPVLKAYSETPVSLNASVGLFDLLKLLAFFGQNPNETLNYKLNTEIDPNGFLPFNISREGVLNDELLSGLKKGKK
jgi:LEA14-like dessication related protein